jgi:hypothetical protein
MNLPFSNIPQKYVKTMGNLTVHYTKFEQSTTDFTISNGRQVWYNDSLIRFSHSSIFLPRQRSHFYPDMAKREFLRNDSFNPHVSLNSTGKYARHLSEEKSRTKLTGILN